MQVALVRAGTNITLLLLLLLPCACRYTCKALTASFCLPPSELFDWIEEQPLACGSIGQVHRGRLSATGAALTGCAPGDTVAIKVGGGCRV